MIARRSIPFSSASSCLVCVCVHHFLLGLAVAKGVAMWRGLTRMGRPGRTGWAGRAVH